MAADEESDFEFEVEEQALGCRNSFDPDTQVLMANGHMKSIMDIKVGDKVSATDPKNGVTKSEKVTELHNNHDTDLTDIVVAGQGGTSVLHTTWSHPFWNLTPGAWVPASRLPVGARLLTATGAAVQVAAVHSWSDTQAMFNLTIDELHTYYVLAGNTPVLVHNCDEFMLEDLGEGWYESPNHLLYGPGSIQGHRILHVMDHAHLNFGKPIHSVFDTGSESVLETVDDAWLNRGGATSVEQRGTRTTWVIPMGRQVGINGERNITIVVNNGDEVISAFPSS